MTLSHCILGTFDDNTSGTYSLTDTTTAAPLFVDDTNDNYRPSASSPAIDAADAANVATEDLDGNPRPVSDEDIGAFEGPSVLPIELLSFKAYAQQEKVNLEWITLTEINNDYFTIERSKNGIDFYPILHIQGAGNSTHLLNYSDKDFHPFTGISYYRLKQTDYDGKYTYSKIVSVNYNTSNSINIHPNPSKNGIFYIEQFQNVKQIKVIDALGQLVKTHTNINTKILNLSACKKGIYYLVTTTENNLITEKISIQ